MTWKIKANFILAAFLLASSLPAFSQVEQSRTPRELRAAASSCMAQGAFSEAIPIMEELIAALGESKKEETIRSMEIIYYNLGICYFFTGQFKESEKAFTAYLKKYPKGYRIIEANIYIADGLRFLGEFDNALKLYEDILKKFERRITKILRIDVMCSMVRCHLPKDRWAQAIPILTYIYRRAPDSSTRNWAATLLGVAYLKENQIENIYKMVPYLLQPKSFASHSAAFNIAALECGDRLFADEFYRDALWIYRLVYPQDLLIANAEKFKAYLERKAERTKGAARLRELMHLQQRIGEMEFEIKALEAMENYDNELTYRIARGYMETRSYREAREVYLFLHETSPSKEIAEECLYLGFRCSIAIQDYRKSFELGEKYMEKYPCGTYFDPLTLAMGQIYAKLQDWPEVIRHFNKTLEVNPKHEDGAECMFFLGYAYFMEEMFADSAKWFSKMNKDYPGNPREMISVYWLGMSLLFDGKYDEAGMEFEHYLQMSSGNIENEDMKEIEKIREDASFRRAVCDYGLSKYDQAGTFLKRFVAEFPESKLVGEAYMMLADIAGVDGDLKQAIEYYQQVPNHDINIELYNYCMFRCGEMLYNDLQDYDRTIDHFQAYMARNLPGSNFPQAVYYIGTCLWQKNEQTGALKYFMDALEKYGNDKTAIGIDLILDEWIGKAKSAEKKIADQAWLDFKTAMKKARQEGRRVLALRLNRALFYEPGITDEDKARLMKDIVKAENIPFSGPGVLQMILDEAFKRGDIELAKTAAQEMIDSFTETDYALDARMFLAQEAVKAKDYKTAEKHLNVIKEVFAASGQAAEALNMLGNMYLDNKDYDKAYDAFKSILAVKEWKGPLWPAALYGMAEAEIGKKRLDKACVPLEKIYIMYSHYKNWAAKAYLKRAECLKSMNMYREAAETLQDMMKKPELMEMPEAEKAKKELEQLQRRI